MKGISGKAVAWLRHGDDLAVPAAAGLRRPPAAAPTEDREPE